MNNNGPWDITPHNKGNSGGSGCSAEDIEGCWGLFVAVAFMIFTYYAFESNPAWCHGVFHRLLQLASICVSGYIGFKLAGLIFKIIAYVAVGLFVYFCVLHPLYNWICS